jgi:hypothetical protein
MGTTTVNGLIATAPVVSTFGGNTVSVTNGSTTFVWNDKNGDGKVSNGDVMARTRQGDGSALVWHVGEDEGMMAWGDPHLDNVKFSEEGKKATMESLDAMFQDAKDGKLDNEGLLTDAETVSRAQVNKQARTLIVGFEADMKLQMGAGAELAMDVEQSDLGIAINKVDLTVTDASGKPLVLTLGEVWGGRGGNGKASVTDTTNQPQGRAIAPGAEKVPTFYEQAGANLSNKTLFYGADSGTNPYENVITADGQMHKYLGRQGPHTVQFYDEAVVKQDQDSMLRFSQSLRGIRTEYGGAQAIDEYQAQRTAEKQRKRESEQRSEAESK